MVMILELDQGVMFHCMLYNMAFTNWVFICIYVTQPKEKKLIIFWDAMGSAFRSCTVILQGHEGQFEYVHGTRVISHTVSLLLNPS